MNWVPSVGGDELSVDLSDRPMTALTSERSLRRTAIGHAVFEGVRFQRMPWEVRVRLPFGRKEPDSEATPAAPEPSPQVFIDQARWLLEWDRQRSESFVNRAIAILGFDGVALTLLLDSNSADVAEGHAHITRPGRDRPSLTRAYV